MFGMNALWVPKAHVMMKNIWGKHVTWQERLSPDTGGLELHFKLCLAVSIKNDFRMLQLKRRQCKFMLEDLFYSLT